MTYRRFIKSSFCSFETAENYFYKTSYSLPSCLKSTVSKSSFSKVLKQLKTSFLKQRKIILVVLKKPFSCSSDTPKKSGIETASMPAFWNFRLQPQKNIVVCIIGFLVVLKLLHTRSFDTSFPYLGRKRHNNADGIPATTTMTTTATMNMTC